MMAGAFAVELVLGSFMQAVCIDDSRFQNQPDLFDSFSDGSLSLLFASQTGSKSSSSNALSSKIKSNPFVESLVGQVKVAKDFAEAMQLRSTLMDGESLVTKSGIWLEKIGLRFPMRKNYGNDIAASERNSRYFRRA